MNIFKMERKGKPEDEMRGLGCGMMVVYPVNSKGQGHGFGTDF